MPAIHISADGTKLSGDLHTPNGVHGVVLFAHGSGSSHLSPRNKFVARALQEAGFATLLFDLLTEEEEKLDQNTGRFRFDIDLLANRLVHATNWLVGQPQFDRARFGYLGASTGAAAALIAATKVEGIGAIVSRGGRPDLAGSALEHVKAPVLLLVGAEDRDVLELNQRAFLRLTGEKQLEIIPGATHLFSEPGALEQVAQLARHWFEHSLRHRNQAIQAT